MHDPAVILISLLTFLCIILGCSRVWLQLQTQRLISEGAQGAKYKTQDETGLKQILDK